jgi:hypothetical protein
MNITEFKTGDIIVKILPSTIIKTVSDGMFNSKKAEVQSRNYMSCIFKFKAVGNNFAYLESLNGYKINNKPNLTILCIDEYGSGWDKLVIPEGMTLEEILNK